MHDLKRHGVTPEALARATDSERTDILDALRCVGLQLADNNLADYVEELFQEARPARAGIGVPGGAIPGDYSRAAPN